MNLNEQREKVLIFGDLPLGREEFDRSGLTKYAWATVSTIFEAIRTLKDHEISVVVTVLTHAGSSGIELLTHVVQNYEDIAVIVVSDNTRPLRPMDAVKLGAFESLIKPIEPDVLSVTIDNAVELRNLRSVSRRQKKELELCGWELKAESAKLRRLQAHIAHNQEMISLGQFVTGAAQRLHDPSIYIYGSLDLLRAKIDDLLRLVHLYDQSEMGDETEKQIDELKRAINYPFLAEDIDFMIADSLEGIKLIRDVVQDLLTFSRPECAEFKRTTIHAEIDSALRLLSDYLSAGNITVVREYGELPKFRSYPTQFKHVWINLLKNALQAVAPEGGEVRIRTKLVGDEVVVSVSDTGCGIPPEHLHHIFEPFFTIHEASDESGLGLTTARGIIERYNGKLSVASKPGAGSTFTVSVPLYAKHCPKT
jgi:signal transduction histidine kinase